MCPCVNVAKAYTNTVCVSNLGNGNCGLICETKNTLRKMKTGMLGMLLQPKLGLWNMSWGPDSRTKKASFLSMTEKIVQF